MFKYAYLLPFYPLIQMIRVQYAYGMVSHKKWLVVCIWFIKLVILEPFRLFEAMVMLFLPEKKVQPIFIIGYYRSGTTYLQELLSSDKQHRTLTLFQSILPEISLCFSWLFIPILSTITTLFKVKNNYHTIPFNWNFPGEEDVAINAMMAFHDYNRIYQYPSQYENITHRYLNIQNSTSVEKWFDNYRYLIHKLRYIYGNKQLLLKSPPNMGRIQLLRNKFPGAKFIFIHRDPFVAITSAKRLWKLNSSFSFEEYSESTVEKILIAQYTTMYDLFKAQGGHTVCLNITFENLITDTSGTIKMIYKNLGLEGWEDAKDRINAITIKRKKATTSTIQNIPPFLNEATKIHAIRKELGYLN